MNRIKAHFIVNPVSGGGRTQKLFSTLIPVIRKLFGIHYQVHITAKPGDATRFTREILGTPAELLIAVGGDGTAQEVVNGFYDGKNLVSNKCELGIINAGTGRGLTNTLKLPPSSVEQLRQLVDFPGRAVDTGLVSYRDVRGEIKSRLFINECQVGIGGKVAERVSLNHKILGGTLAFGSVAAVETIRYKARDYRLRIGEEQEIGMKLIGIVIGNGAHCAGGMQLTPYAKPNDGLLDVLLIRDMNPLSRLWNFSRVYSGKHIRSDYFTYRCCRKIKIDAAEKVLAEADGELLGSTPLNIEMMDDRIRIRCNLQIPE